MRAIAYPPFVCMVLIGAACARPRASPLEDQLARGEAIYRQGCATPKCHGSSGEGLRSDAGFSAWPLVGAEFQARNPTAQVVFDVVRSGGEPSLRALTDQQIYDSIAYELSLNGVVATQVITAQNAASLPTGSAAGSPEPGSLFPPPSNARLRPRLQLPALPRQAEGSQLRIRLTQLALVTGIGGTDAPGDGSYAVLVFVLEDLADRPLAVGPERLSLVTASGATLVPLNLALAFPVARFSAQSIQPNHGTAAYAVFALPAQDALGKLLYATPSGQELSVDLSPLSSP